MLSNILFDLDGTLTDPKEGITRCIQYALTQLGQLCPDEEYLTSLIGLPLHSIFKEILYSNENDSIEEAISLFRKRFSDVGIFENEVYLGIAELLDVLHKNSYKLWVVTFKPKIWAEKIVENLSLDQWLSGVFGPTLDERLYDKIELVESVLLATKMTPANTAIVGDRKEDIIAGKTKGIVTIGVTYGYGSEEEIIDEDPDYICDSPREVQKAVMNH